MKYLRLASAPTMALAIALTSALAGAAMAGQCAKLMGEIDAALAANPQISADQKAEVMKLRGEGEAQHAAGQHAESVATLDKAKTILGLK